VWNEQTRLQQQNSNARLSQQTERHQRDIKNKNKQYSYPYRTSYSSASSEPSIAMAFLLALPMFYLGVFMLIIDVLYIRSPYYSWRAVVAATTASGASFTSAVGIFYLVMQGYL
jgi:hypothetical protein